MLLIAFRPGHGSVRFLLSSLVSAYDFSSTTTIAYENLWDLMKLESGFSLNSTFVFGPTIALIALRIIVPIFEHQNKIN